MCLFGLILWHFVIVYISSDSRRRPSTALYLEHQVSVTVREERRRIYEAALPGVSTRGFRMMKIEKRAKRPLTQRLTFSYRQQTRPADASPIPLSPRLTQRPNLQTERPVTVRDQSPNLPRAGTCSSGTCSSVSTSSTKNFRENSHEISVVQQHCSCAAAAKILRSS